MMNPSIWNPSYAALKNQYMMCLHHRTQWLGYSTTNSSDNIQAPNTQLVTLTAPIQKLKSGIGLGVMNDNLGPIRNFNALVSYAYGFDVGLGKLATGVSFGIQSMYLNTNTWRPENVNDPTLSVISSGTLNQLKPVFRFGLGYSDEKFYIGLSVNNLFTPSYSFSNSGIESKLVRHYYLQSSYLIYLSEKVSLQPSILTKNAEMSMSIEASNLFLIGNIWTGLAFRTGDAATFLAGINLLADKSLKVGYNLDLSVLNNSAKALTSHEIFLSYNLASFLDNRKPIVRSPRFRY